MYKAQTINTRSNKYWPNTLAQPFGSDSSTNRTRQDRFENYKSRYISQAETKIIIITSWAN